MGPKESFPKWRMHILWYLSKKMIPNLLDLYIYGDVDDAKPTREVLVINKGN
jgi:hypothetical protein